MQWAKIRFFRRFFFKTKQRSFKSGTHLRMVISMSYSVMLEKFEFAKLNVSLQL